MKILFLDVDGVVNCPKTTQRFRGRIGIDPYMASLVRKIVNDTGAKVVLSSTWRLFEHDRPEVKKQVVDFMDITPALCSIRGDEISAWLAVNANVKKYAILDDDSDFLPGQMLFQTSWEVGLTEEIANKVIKYLGKK